MIMGLFGPSKSEILRQRVNDVEVFYERMVKVFKDNIRIKTVSEYYTRHIHGIPLYINRIDDLFKNYPDSLLNDKEYSDFYVQNLTNAVLSREFGGYQQYNYVMKYDFPFPRSHENIKSNITLVVNAAAMNSIQQISSDFFQFLNDAIDITNKNKGNYPYYHKCLVAMYYRTRGAVAWFNYLDKTSM